MASEISPNSSDREIPTHTTKDTAMTDTTEDHTTDEGSEAADDLGDVTADDYATAAAQLAQEAATAQDVAADEVDADEPDSTPREQRYRQRARGAEAERDRLSALVDGMRSTEVERLAATKLADPSDVFRDGATLADVLDDDGRVDPVKVDELIDTVIGQHPHWRVATTPYRGPMHSGATNTRQVETPSKGFADAFTPKTE